MRIGWALAFVVVLASGRARADTEAARGTELRQRYWVDFEAGRVELDPELDRLKLDRGVRVRVDRYQLTGRRVTLTRTARGVVVEGEGAVAFCRCESPPLTFSFREAIVAPPTDLFVREPTVRLGGVPVFWLPVLWLRAPDRLGLLAPRVGWRGDDGLIAGAGVHVPVGGKRGPTLKTLDVLASGYFQGGVELDAKLSTADTSTRVRWDHLDESLLAVEAHGSAVGPSEATAAWRVDALRGERGRRGTLELEPAARRYDRASASVGASDGGFVGAFGAELTAARAGAIDELGAVGPRLELGFGSALGAGSSIDSAVALSTLRTGDERSESALVQHAELGGDLPLGPLLASGSLGERLLQRSAPSTSSVALLGGGRAALALPLERAYGGGVDPLLHRIEPSLGATGRTGARREHAGAPLELYDASTDERLLFADAAVRTSLGSFGDRAALAVTARAARFVEPEAASLVAGTLGADAEAVAARVEAANDPEDAHDLYVAGRTRLGRADGLHLTSHVESRRVREPVAARALVDETWSSATVGWLEAPGTSAGGELTVPWMRELATSVFADADLDRERILAVGGAAGYRHHCGCLATRAWVGRRVGRGGFDAIVTLDLLP